MPESAQSPRGSERMVARNFAALGGGEVVARLLAFAATAYVARTLGPAPYGVIEVALAILLYSSRVADFGVDLGLGVREIAARPERLRALAPSVLTGRLGVSSVMALALAAIGTFVLDGPEGPVLAVYGLSLLAVGLSTRWIHIGREKTVPVSVARFLGELTMVVLVLTFVRQADDLLWVPWAKVTGDLLAALLLYLFLARDGFSLRFQWDWPKIKPLVPGAWNLVLSALLGLMIYNADLLLLRVFRDAATVGYYAAAYTLVSFLTNVGISYATSLLPTLTRLGERVTEQRALYATAHVQVFLIGVPIAMGGGVVAAALIQLVFGNEYATSVLALQILLWTVPVGFARDVAVMGLIAREREDLVFRLTGWSAAMNVALNLALIPSYGIAGAAVATVATETVRMILAVFLASRHGLALPRIGRMWQAGLAGVVMVAVVVALDRSIFLAVPVGALVYALVVFVCGGHKGLLPDGDAAQLE